MALFTVELLSEDQLVEADAMIRIAGANSPAGWWGSEAGELIRRGGGVLAARSGDGALHGLATYEVVRRQRAGRVLAVGTLLSFDLSRKQPAKQALVHALELISDAFDCSAIAVPLRVKGHLESLAGDAAARDRLTA